MSVAPGNIADMAPHTDDYPEATPPAPDRRAPSRDSPNRTASPAPGWLTTSETTDLLSETATGCWLVSTHNSHHVWNLDNRTYRRLPGSDSQSFPYDRTDLPIARVELWPQVGARFLVWFDDPGHPDLTEHYRVSSAIESIVRLRPEPRSWNAPDHEPDDSGA